MPTKEPGDESAKVASTKVASTKVASTKVASTKVASTKVGSTETQPSLFIVSNRLPISINFTAKTHELQIQASSGGLVAGLRALQHSAPLTWIGYAGTAAKPSLKQERSLTENLQERGLVAVPLDAEVYKRYYQGMSNATLWPLFHYFFSDLHFSWQDWQAYVQVNLHFAAVVLSLAKAQDRVWVHDYHLMLLPAMLRAAKQELKIAYFHHIPFPSSDIFRILPVRAALLEGLLGADLIGFHSYDYARHFLLSVARVLSYETYLDEVFVGERLAKVGVFPLGADVQAIREQLRHLKTSQKHSELAQSIGTPFLFLGIDRLDYTKGLCERIEAFRYFLKSYPAYVGKVTFVQLCVPTRQEVPRYLSYKARVERLIAEVNGEFGSPSYTPIHYLYQNQNLEKIVALYKAAHVALVTPLRDGLNLVAKEYVASRDDGDGVLILSEFAGASIALGEALWVNPYDSRAIAERMYEAITMPKVERQRRMRRMRRRILASDNLAWSKAFIASWEKCASTSLHRSKYCDRATKKHLLAEIKKKKRKFIFCDNDGTLIFLQTQLELAIPDRKIIAAISQLSEQEGVVFTLISGRPRSYCEKYYGSLPINLFAEHGAFYKACQSQAWDLAIEGEEFKTLRLEILPILQQFCMTVPGSLVEEKELSLVWHYRQAEPEFGEHQAKALLQSLQLLLNQTSYMVCVGKKVIEVRHRMAHKGHAVERILKAYEWQEDDFLLTLGDDLSDEEMYRIMPQKNYSIHVGRQNILAKYFVGSPDDVRIFFNNISAHIKKSS